VREFMKNVYVDKRYAGTTSSERPPRDAQAIYYETLIVPLNMCTYMAKLGLDLLFIFPSKQSFVLNIIIQFH
jgi:hypothetical protein